MAESRYFKTICGEMTAVDSPTERGPGYDSSAQIQEPISKISAHIDTIVMHGQFKLDEHPLDGNCGTQWAAH